MKKTYKRIIFFSSLILLLFMGIYFFNIFRLSYYSYQFSCVAPEDRSVPEEYVIVGQASYDTETGETTFYQNYSGEADIDLQVTKHEICHILQFYDGKISTCNQPLTRIALEAECYIAEDLPEFIYNWKYFDVKEFNKLLNNSYE